LGNALITFGFFEARPSDFGTRIRVDAFGDTGEERFEVYADGELRGTFSASTELSTFVVDLPDFEFINPSSVIVRFVNDDFDPATGRDNNLTVDSIQLIGLDGESIQQVGEGGGFFAQRGIYRPGSNLVFSTGTFSNGAITEGFGVGNTLHVDGYFQIVNPVGSESFNAGVIA